MYAGSACSLAASAPPCLRCMTHYGKEAKETPIDCARPHTWAVVSGGEEQQKIRNLYAAGLAVGAVVLLVIGFAAAFTYVIQPNQEVAKVNGTSINRATYNKLRRWNLYQQLQQDVLTQQLGSKTGTTADTTAITNYRPPSKGSTRKLS